MKTKVLLVLALILGVSTSIAKATHYLVEDGDDYDGIDLVNSDTLLMTGGRIGGLRSYATSSATILNTNPMGSMNAGISLLYAYDSSTINFSGGSVWNFYGFGSSTINIDGGAMHYLIMRESSIGHLSGGQILTDLAIPVDTSYVHIYGYDFNHDPLGGIENEGLLTGYWPGGEAFSISLNNWKAETDVITYDQIIFHVIPEPTSILLIGIGGLIISRKQIKNL